MPAEPLAMTPSAVSTTEVRGAGITLPWPCELIDSAAAPLPLSPSSRPTRVPVAPAWTLAVTPYTWELAPESWEPVPVEVVVVQTVLVRPAIGRALPEARSPSTGRNRPPHPMAAASTTATPTAIQPRTELLTLIDAPPDG